MPNAYWYPLSLGGAPGGVASEMPFDDHMKKEGFHWTLGEEFVKIGGPGARDGDGSRRVWLSIDDVERRRILETALVAGGVDASTPEAQNWLDVAFKMAEPGKNNSKFRATAKPIVVDVPRLDMPRGQRLLPPGLNKALTIAVGVGIAHQVFSQAAQGAELISALDIRDPRMKDMIATSRKARATWQLDMIDEVFILHDMYQITNDYYASNFGWVYWFKNLWK